MPLFWRTTPPQDRPFCTQMLTYNHQGTWLAHTSRLMDLIPITVGIPTPKDQRPHIHRSFTQGYCDFTACLGQDQGAELSENKTGNSPGSHEGKHSDLDHHRSIGRGSWGGGSWKPYLHRSPGKGMDVALHMLETSAGYWGGSTHGLPFKFSLHLCGYFCVSICLLWSSTPHINKTPHPGAAIPLLRKGDVTASCEISFLWGHSKQKSYPYALNQVSKCWPSYQEIQRHLKLTWRMWHGHIAKKWAELPSYSQKGAWPQKSLGR